MWWKKNEARKPIVLEADDLGNIIGASTGDSEHKIVSGGWAGTDDATSTAPSDLIGNPAIPEEDKSFQAITRDMDERIWRDDEEQIDRMERVDEQSELDERNHSRRALAECG